MTLPPTRDLYPEVGELAGRAITAGPVPSLTLNEAEQQWLVMEAARRYLAAEAATSPACAIVAEMVTPRMLETGPARERARSVAVSVEALRHFGAPTPTHEELLLLMVQYLRGGDQAILAGKTAAQLTHETTDTPLVGALWAVAGDRLLGHLAAEAGPIPIGPGSATMPAWRAYAEAARAALAAGLSQREVAAGLGINARTVAKMEQVDE